MWCPSPSDAGPQMWDNDRLEAGGAGNEKIHPRHNKGDRRLLNTLQGNSGQTSKGDTICHGVVVRSYSYRSE